MSVDLAKLEQHLSTRSYVEGWVYHSPFRISVYGNCRIPRRINTDTGLIPRYTPSQADVRVFKAISSPPSGPANPHVARWYTHIKSYAAEHESLAGSSAAGEAFVAKASEPAAAPAAAEEDDEIDLFGDDEEEDAEAERIKAERVAAYNAKKANKPKTVAKVRWFFLKVRHHDYLICIALFIVSSNNGCQTLGWWNGYGSPREICPIYWTRWPCLGC